MEALQDYIHTYGAQEVLVYDNAQLQLGDNWTQVLQYSVTAVYSSYPHIQNQNPS